MADAGALRSRRIEAPEPDDLLRIAQDLAHASRLVLELTGTALSGRPRDLTLLQLVLSARYVEPHETYSLQALGVAVGRLLVDNNPGFDWWMVEDARGREPAVRYLETPLLVFPHSMIASRFALGEDVDVLALYRRLVAHPATLPAEQCSGA